MSHARTFRLTEKTYTHLHDFAKQHNLSDNAALNKLICEHQENQGQEIDILAKKVIDLLEGKYKNLFTRIRLASTMADRRTEVIVEILNSLVYHLEAEDSYNTELMKSAIVEDSENTVKTISRGGGTGSALALNIKTPGKLPRCLTYFAFLNKGTI